MNSWLKNLFDKLFKNDKGQIVVAQFPNIPIICFIVFYILSLVFKSNRPTHLFKALAIGSIFTWAWLELFYGVNYFRRLLGLVVLIITITSLISYVNLVINK